VFALHQGLIDSDYNNLNSNEVLETVRIGLENQGYQIEKSKKTVDKIKVPVLFGINGKLEKYFEADGYDKISKTVIEVEAGRAVTNYQFLKDLFQACIMFDIDYLIIAVRNNYRGNPDFQNVNTFLDTLYVSDRLKLPLKGVLIIGY
jgi:hypothetical protein